MTIQVSDKLIYQGKEFRVSGGSINPFGKMEDKSFIESLFSDTFLSSGCWRRYVATWVIEDDQLKLKEVRDYFSNENKLDVIYPLSNCEVLANWISKEVEAYSGEKIGDCGAYMPVFENYHLFEIKEGRVIRYDEYDGETWMIKHKCIKSNEDFHKLLNKS